MEEEKKSNKRLYVVIALLCFLVLGLVGYIIYDKSLNNTQKVVNTNNKDSKVDKETNDSKENKKPPNYKHSLGGTTLFGNTQPSGLSVPFCMKFPSSN